MVETDGLTVRVYREIAVYSWYTYHTWQCPARDAACDVLVEETYMIAFRIGTSDETRN